MSDLILLEKICTKCHETKPFSEFHRNRSTNDGRGTYCAACVRSAVAAHRLKQIALIGEDEVRAKEAAAVRKHRAAGRDDPRDRVAYRNAMYALRRRHSDEFTALLRQERYNLGLDPDNHRRGGA